MPINGELIEVAFVTETPCLLEEAEQVERLLRPQEDNFWLDTVAPTEALPALNWVARYRWYDNETTKMML